MSFTAFSELVFTDFLCYEDGGNNSNKLQPWATKGVPYCFCSTYILFSLCDLAPFHVVSVSVWSMISLVDFKDKLFEGPSGVPT